MPDRSPAPTRRLTVRRTERITPHMIRVIASGELTGFDTAGYTDAYVKVVFRVPGVSYPEPFDMARIREELPRAQWPRLRTYTVRAHDPATGELTLDFVHHGDTGLAGPWAAGLRPGDEFFLLGPGGGYAPSAEADGHLLVGDESALPAIAVALEALPAGVPATVFLLVDSPAEEQELKTDADARVHWLHRQAGADGDALVRAVREQPLPAGQVQAFVHGEAGFFRALRRYLIEECDIRRDLLSASGYWREGKDDEGWREEKAAERAASAG